MTESKEELYSGKCDGCQITVTDKTLRKLPAPPELRYMLGGRDYSLFCPSCFEHVILEIAGTTKEGFLDDLGLKSGLE